MRPPKKNIILVLFFQKKNRRVFFKTLYGNLHPLVLQGSHLGMGQVIVSFLLKSAYFRHGVNHFCEFHPHSSYFHNVVSTGLLVPKRIVGFTTPTDFHSLVRPSTNLAKQRVFALLAIHCELYRDVDGAEDVVLLPSGMIFQMLYEKGIWWMWIIKIVDLWDMDHQFHWFGG